MSDLRAAVERLRKLKSGDRSGYSECKDANAVVQDFETLANAYLAERDDTPVDESWLREQGWESGRFLDMGYNFALTWDGHEIVIHAESSERDSQVFQFPTAVRTRGDVLRLLSVLQKGGD